MNNSHYIPRKDADFYRWIENFLTSLRQNIQKFNFPQEVFDHLEALQADFNAKFAIAKDPNTRTPVAVQAKTSSRKLLEKTVRTTVKEFLTYNRLVSDGDRIGLGIPVYKTTRTAAQVAHEAPDVDVDTSVLGHVGIHFFEKGHKHKKAKPAGQHAVEIAWVISDTPPTRWDELLHSVVDTRTPYTFSFEYNQRGKNLYFALRWENTRGEKGPWSEIHSTVIP